MFCALLGCRCLYEAYGPRAREREERERRRQARYERARQNTDASTESNINDPHYGISRSMFSVRGSDRDNMQMAVMRPEENYEDNYSMPERQV